MPHFSAVYGSSLKTELLRNKTDDKAVSLHRYSSFYFVFDILERQKSFQIGPIVVQKNLLEKFLPEERKKFDSEDMGKLVTFLKKINEINATPMEKLSEFGKSLKPVADQLAQFMKVTTYSYQSLLEEGLLSIRKTHDFDKKGRKVEMSSPSP